RRGVGGAGAGRARGAGDAAGGGLAARRPAPRLAGDAAGRRGGAGRARLPRVLPAVLHLAVGAAPDRPGAWVPAAAAGLPGDLPGLAGGGLRLAAGAAAGQPARAADPLAEPAAARPAARRPG